MDGYLDGWLYGWMESGGAGPIEEASSQGPSCILSLHYIKFHGNRNNGVVLSGSQVLASLMLLILEIYPSDSNTYFSHLFIRQTFIRHIL